MGPPLKLWSQGPHWHANVVTGCVLGCVGRCRKQESKMGKELIFSSGAPVQLKEREPMGSHRCPLHNPSWISAWPLLGVWIKFPARIWWWSSPFLSYPNYIEFGRGMVCSIGIHWHGASSTQSHFLSSRPPWPCAVSPWSGSRCAPLHLPTEAHIWSPGSSLPLSLAVAGLTPSVSVPRWGQEEDMGPAHHCVPFSI